MMQKRWRVAPAAPAALLAGYRGFSPIFAQALYNRGFLEPVAAQEFLQQRDLREDPFAMKGMAAAVARIQQALAAGQPIAVYGDFDADGICATVLLVEVLQALGGQARPYIPDRDAEGYGLNRQALEGLAARGIALVITVDCGIRSIDEVVAGRRAGLDIIITDHHSIGPELPSALAIVNPQQADCPGEAGLAGVGVAFMLAQALLQQRWRSDRQNYPDIRLSDLLDLVAIGTVADVMSLNIGLNRRLVRHGLVTINEMRRPGIAALAQVAQLNSGGIRASHIGFGLGPRINAAGRLGSAMTAYRLLAAATIEEAEPLAQELHNLNRLRRKKTSLAQAVIGEGVAAAAEIEDIALIFAGAEDIAPGIIGLVAGRLAERFYRPAVVLQIGAEESRASCRSIPEFNITRALDECADLLLRHGGHAMAAGFTVANSNMAALRQALEQRARATLAGQQLAPQLSIDCEIPPSALGAELIAELELLEPTGHKNPAPVFMTRAMPVLQFRRVGAEGRHLKLLLGGGRPLDAIGFGLGDWAAHLPKHIDAAYQLEMNEWNGQRSLQMRLLDIRPPTAPQESA